MTKSNHCPKLHYRSYQERAADQATWAIRYGYAKYREIIAFRSLLLALGL